jgi:hypothetical protein
VAGGSVRFSLANGETLTISEAEVRPLYDRLWQAAGIAGAVTTAALLLDAFRQSEFTRPTIELTAPQSAVLREALARHHHAP